MLGLKQTKICIRNNNNDNNNNNTNGVIRRQPYLKKPSAIQFQGYPRNSGQYSTLDYASLNSVKHVYYMYIVHICMCISTNFVIYFQYPLLFYLFTVQVLYFSHVFQTILLVQGCIYHIYSKLFYLFRQIFSIYHMCSKLFLFIHNNNNSTCSYSKLIYLFRALFATCIPNYSTCSYSKLIYLFRHIFSIYHMCSKPFYWFCAIFTLCIPIYSTSSGLYLPHVISPNYSTFQGYIYHMYS